MFTIIYLQGRVWQDSDSDRKKKAGKSIGTPAALCQVTGDWKMYKQVFRFPQHNETHGCCFKCAVKPVFLLLIS